MTKTKPNIDEIMHEEAMKYKADLDRDFESDIKQLISNYRMNLQEVAGLPLTESQAWEVEIPAIGLSVHVALEAIDPDESSASGIEW